MQRSRPATIVSVIAAFAAATAASLAGADERVLHRSVLPDGSVVYADTPVRGSQESTAIRVEPHPADPQAAGRAQAALQQQQLATLRAADLRLARIGELDSQIAAAAVSHAAALRELEATRTPAEGDRQGRRLTAQYFQRSADAAAKVDAAARRLAALEQARAILTP